MTLAVDLTDGRGISNETRHELLLKKSCIYHLLHSKWQLSSCTLLTRQSALVLKSGHAMQVVKLIKEDWPMVLH